MAEKGAIRFGDALGSAVKTDEIEIAATLETIYDAASLTKVLVTALLCAQLYEQAKMRLTTLIKDVLPEFAVFDKKHISFENLLAHTSGFAAWQPLYLMANLPDGVLQSIADAPRESRIGERVRYSDFNFIALGFLLEKLHGRSLNEIAQTEIFAKLNLTQTFFNPPRELQHKIAACEFGNEYEKQVCREQGFNVDNQPFAFRKRLIWAEVHDGNCWFMNGVSGHAGLFSTAAEIFKIAQQFLPSSTVLLQPETCELFKTNLTPNLNEARSFGFELAANELSTASEALAKNSFGHLGFTGTSVWIEPNTERIFILLTNRTHRPLPFVNINSTRRKFHELTVAALDEQH